MWMVVMSRLLPLTSVVNIRVANYDVYIGRAGHGHDGYFGNPFVLTPVISRISVLTKYEKWFYERLGSDLVFRKRIHDLKGKTLGCFCSPKLCHGHIIADYLNWEVAA